MACIRPSGRGGTWSPSLKKTWVPQHQRAEPAILTVQSQSHVTGVLSSFFFFFCINEL